MQLYEIYNAEFTWNGCVDMRPWVTVEIRAAASFSDASRSLPNVIKVAAF